MNLAPETLARLRELGVDPSALKAPKVKSVTPAPLRALPAPAPIAAPALLPVPAPSQLPAKRRNSPPSRDHAAYECLTRCECRAAGLPYVNDKLAKDGAHHWALVTFADGLQMLVSFYQWASKAKRDPLSLIPAMSTARARYLLIVSGGRFYDAACAPKVPPIAAVRFVHDMEERESLRHACLAQRKALEEKTPGFNPLYQSTVVSDFRGITYPKRARVKRRRFGG